MRIGRNFTNMLETSFLTDEERKLFKEGNLPVYNMDARVQIRAKRDIINQLKVGKDIGLTHIELDGGVPNPYLEISDEEIKKAQSLIEHAIGFDRTRGDSVVVQHIQFNRIEQFDREDEEFRNQRRIQQAVIYYIIGVAVSIVAFIIFRVISREMERRRRLREEELARQHQMMREAALKSAEEEEMDVAMSVEERARMEMQENAINMAREHPEDVAQLIRTWLVEE